MRLALVASPSSGGEAEHNRYRLKLTKPLVYGAFREDICGVVLSFVCYIASIGVAAGNVCRVTFTFVTFLKSFHHVITNESTASDNKHRAAKDMAREVSLPVQNSKIRRHARTFSSHKYSSCWEYESYF